MVFRPTDGRSKMKRRKPVDPEPVRKRTEKAIFALQKSVVVAGQHGWITPEQSSILSGHLLHFEQAFLVAFPTVETENESEACLPF